MIIIDNYHINKKVKNILYSLWFFTKIQTTKDLTEYEKESFHKTILFNFELLDKFKVPFIIQNKILTLVERKESFDNFIFQHKKSS